MFHDTDSHIINQNWGKFTPEEHDLWRLLYKRQASLLTNRATPEFIKGVEKLGIAAEGIPKFEDINKILRTETGWEIVAVEGLVPDAIFFTLLSSKKFPSTCFLRTPDQIDYLQEPDIFHDTYGHVPLLVDPYFADYMESYGKAALQAMDQNSLHYISRLYWFTVEFGLIKTTKGLRIYGSGIVSSSKESVYCLESPKPYRIKFDVERCMRTNYRIDDLQDTYFVIDSFEQLIKATTKDFLKIYEKLMLLPDYKVGQHLKEDKVIKL